MQSRDALLTVSVVVDEVETVLVEGRSQVGLSNGQTNGIGETLAEGAGGNLDTISVTGLRMPRSQGVNLTELLEIIHGELVAHEVEEDVLKRATVSGSISASNTYSGEQLTRVCNVWH